MEITSFIIRVVFLALPGLVGISLYRKLKGKKSQKDWEDVIEIAIFSLLSYSTYGVLVFLLREFGCITTTFESLRALTNESVPLPLHEILIATAIATALGFLASYIYTQQLINRLGQALGVSSRAGDDDVWTYFHHHLNPNQGWVYVRDHKLGLVYYGWIKYASETNEERELILMDVDVFQNATFEKLYSTKAMYLSRLRDDLTIEVVLQENQE